MKRTLVKQIITTTFIVLCLFSRFIVNGQACTPAGDQTTYGTGNVWIGYVYSGVNFNTYHGYVTEGTVANYAFDQSFGGASVPYATNGCPVTTDVFSVRYKLTKTFTNQNIDFTVSGDDGFRLSIDGGATWLINRWNDQSYATGTASVYLNGTYNLVLEYYENTGSNRITFSAAVACSGTGDPSIYGTNNVWQAYIYQGTNFGVYKGSKTEGATLDPNFDEGFGGDNVSMGFLTCPINTEAFSARFRLRRNMPAGTYVFTIGGDDGYRFSLDGGVTWVINKFVDQAYNVTSYTATLSGMKDMVIEYYENSGHNRITFTMSASILPVKLTAFNATLTSGDQVQLRWQTQSEVNFNKYIVERSFDGISFNAISSVVAKQTNQLANNYSYIDEPARNGSVYYRLAMNDLDGSTTLSSVVKVTITRAFETRVYPTLVTSQKVTLESSLAIPNATVEIFDINGKKVSTSLQTIYTGKQEINLSQLSIASGSFVIRITGNKQQLISKMIIVQ
jgi:type IX secretion system substrate protein